MEEKMINVPLNQYTDMAIMCGRVKAFEQYVDSQKYNIEKDTIAAILGFGLSERSNDE